MSSININLTVSRSKTGHNEIRVVCCYCKKISKSYEGFRKHLERSHSNEMGFEYVKKQASKLCRIYKGVSK